MISKNKSYLAPSQEFVTQIEHLGIFQLQRISNYAFQVNSDRKYIGKARFFLGCTQNKNARKYGQLRTFGDGLLDKNKKKMDVFMLYLNQAKEFANDTNCKSANAYKKILACVHPDDSQMNLVDEINLEYLKVSTKGYAGRALNNALTTANNELIAKLNRVNNRKDLKTVISQWLIENESTFIKLDLKKDRTFYQNSFLQLYKDIEKVWQGYKKPMSHSELQEEILRKKNKILYQKTFTAFENQQEVQYPKVYKHLDSLIKFDRRRFNSQTDRICKVHNKISNQLHEANEQLRSIKVNDCTVDQKILFIKLQRIENDVSSYKDELDEFLNNQFNNEAKHKINT